MVAFQQIDQLLNLLGLGQQRPGPLLGPKDPRQHDGGSRDARFARASSGSPNALHKLSFGYQSECRPNFQIERDLNRRACFDDGGFCAA